ncbi:glycoside hydrolase domain-containing protein [Phytoactinopolyspora endophytica]|uniref:glycoside hydrolase domain-containing protein n=1 Tax=Phytoactinopolyspora endophytica TaxID=1642495 RepID=UPI00101D8A3A|nr:glycoside hydrolase domain-containing protein [Phytoactinopolyspora endophytica]
MDRSQAGDGRTNGAKRRRLTRTLGAGSLASVLILGTFNPPAVAEPETPVSYPKGASASRATGLAFDTCTAPSLEALHAWQSSPYSTVNVYFGGANRGCEQPELTKSWVQEAAAMGWDLLPTYVGRQPYCVHADGMSTFSESDAHEKGRNNAEDAIAQAKTVGLLPGSALYADIEHYDQSDDDCRTAVRRYVSAWTSTLHANGYLAGVYVHHSSGLADLSGSHGSAHHARPDAIWVADWDRDTTLTGWPNTSDTKWAEHQRAKQYRGDHDATNGGVTLSIDSNAIDAPVATVAHQYQVTSDVGLKARTGPGTSHPATGSHAPGATLSVVCQSGGEKAGATSVWNQLVDGTWVSDGHVSTPFSSGFSDALPRCTYPGQVSSAAPLNARTGPGTSHSTTGSPLSSGSLAWVVCQADGMAVDGTSVWNKLADGRWVSDRYVSTTSGSSWSDPIPRCG